MDAMLVIAVKASFGIRGFTAAFDFYYAMYCAGNKISEMKSSTNLPPRRKRKDIQLLLLTVTWPLIYSSPYFIHIVSSLKYLGFIIHFLEALKINPIAHYSSSPSRIIFS
jgi:hypothetical protein